jgi:hypothetical protein
MLAPPVHPGGFLLQRIAYPVDRPWNRLVLAELDRSVE